MSYQLTRVFLCTVLMTPFFSESVAHFQDRWSKKLTPPLREKIGKQATALAQKRMDSHVACAILSMQEEECVAFEYKRSESCCITYRIVKRNKVNTAAISPSPSAEIYSHMGRNCPSDFRYNLKMNLCFKLNNTLLTWKNAQDDCSKYGRDGRLIILDENEKYYAVQKYLYKTFLDSTVEHHPYVGGNRTSGRYRWLSGREVNKNLWGGNQPDLNGACLVMWSKIGFLLDDFPCGRTGSFVCEVPMA